MRGHRSLEQAPSLVDPQHTDEVRSNRSSVVTGTESPQGRCKANVGANVVDASLIIRDLILSRYRGRYTVTELRGVGKLVHTSDRAAATDETVVVVTRVVR